MSLYSKENLKKLKLNLQVILQWMLDQGLFYISIIAFIGVLAESGFKYSPAITDMIHSFYLISIGIFVLTISIRIVFKILSRSTRRKVLLSEYFLFCILLTILIFQFWVPEGEESKLLFGGLASDLAIIRFSIIILFIIEFSKRALLFQKLNINPALLFTGSFLLIIIIGTFLLLLPKATPNGISLIDALFTSTSAVCVTGLIVLDTSKDFTHFGQLIILILIQIGGLGIMTFTSFFGFFFKGASSIENTLFIQEFVNEKRISQIVRTTLRIIVFTLLFELIGSIFIYLNIASGMPKPSNAIWFSVFHSISAFCNAGFSIFSNGLYEPIIRNSFNLHLIIAILIIIGGIGFPVIFDFYHSFKYVFINRFYQVIGKKKYKHRGRHLTIHSKIVLVTTASLLLVGFLVFFWSEWDNTLEGLSWYGKIATSIFGSVTPRTAGFNTVDMTKLAVPTVLFYLILMWIGASPGSTGGGLKTSTFAVAVLNTLSIAKHKKRIEVFRREISNESVRKAFSVILLSFLIIGLSVFFVTIFNPELPLISVAFECFSAFSTVGLSLGITASLGTSSKIVIIITMFVGRVGTLTILIALIRKARSQSYQFPSENVFIT